MSADEGKRSRPVAHLGFSEERVCSHHSGVVGMRERVGEKGLAVTEEEADVRGAEVIMLELTVAKRLLRLIGKEVRLGEKEGQFSEHSEGEVAILSVCQRVDGCGFLSSRKLGLTLEPNHTVPLSLVDFPGSISGISTVNPKEPVPSVHFLAYCLCDPR